MRARTAEAGVGGRLHGSAVWGPLLLLLALLPPGPVAWGASGRALAQQPLQQQAGQQAPASNPFINAVQPQPVSVYQTQPQTNSGLTVVKTDVSVRLLGSRFVPFMLEHQHIIIEAFKEAIMPYGPIQMVTYKEVLPDMSAPEAVRLPGVPAVEFSFVFYPILNSSSGGPGSLVLNGSASYDAVFIQAYSAYSAWASNLLSEGNWPDVQTPEVLTVLSNVATIQGGFTLHPILVLNMQLIIILALPGPTGRITAAQASAVAQAVQAEVLNRSLGTLVELVGYSGGDSSGRQLLSLEVTLFACRDNATVASPECEGAILGALLEQLIASTDTQLTWQAAGIQSVDIATISLREPPATGAVAPIPSAASDPRTQDHNQSHPGVWVPWHLDRIDQRSLPLDGTYSPTADGTGVNVYIVSSGVSADHDEFQGGSSGVSRVRPAWGYLGINPLEDCPDYFWWHGYGTFAASLCCGLQLGAAKNATIYSVRFRERCFSSPAIWASGALPAAMDSVLSAAVRPAVVLIDTWWSPVRETDMDPAVVGKQIVARLDSFAKANLTVVAPAAQGMNISGTDPCSNVIASHPAVISVAASDFHDQSTALGPSNSSCIDIFAPGGGVGTGNIGAFPTGVQNYTRIISRASASAAIMAGVAAQYLQLHPDATPEQVRQGLIGMATPNVITGAGSASPNSLLFTNLSEPVSQPPAQAPEASQGGGIGAGAITGIVAGACAVLLVVAVFAIRLKRRRELSSVRALTPLSRGSWDVPSSELEICKHSDGSEWLLGEGHHGKVFKALKGGVQVVAVKKLPQTQGSCDSRFSQDLAAMKYASRDANITQFYGVCIEGDSMLLISEFMEGGDLATALSKDDAKNLQWYRQGKEIMLDVVRGAHFLHANNIVHRAIKSKNILLARDGRAKIGDVGVAQLLKPHYQDSAVPAFRGGLAWAAPEDLSGDGPLNAKSDIFSLGVVLWEVVTGEVPIRGQMRNPEVPRECPQGVADAIGACMQADPAKRPTTRELYSILLSCPPEAAVGSGLAANASASSDADENRSQSAEYPSGGSHSSDRRKEGSVKEGSQQGSSSGQGLGTPLSAAELAILTVDVQHIQHCTHSDGSFQCLGTGSFGTVYKVLLDGVQPLAAKVVDLGPTISENEQTIFLREAGLLWRLRHRNIVTLTGVCLSDNKGYLIMELMEGGSLYSRLGVVSRSTMTRVLSWYNKGRHVALDIARGLHYLHSLNVTHFDLKSGNVLLTKEFSAKLADVGLARVMSCTHHSLSHEGSVGTFEYMAPELMAGSKCTAAVDIFSFGVLIWEICTGSHPVRGKLEALSVPEDCPQAVADLFRECTRPDPAARPTAREVVERLSLVTDTMPPKLEAPRHDAGAEDRSSRVASGLGVAAFQPLADSPFLALR